MPDWSIEITVDYYPWEGRKTRFHPERQQVLIDDLISWNNYTSETHEPWPVDGSNHFKPGTGFGVGPIAPDTSSEAYNVSLAPGIVRYGCKNHPTTEIGVLEVLTQPPKT